MAEPNPPPDGNPSRRHFLAASAAAGAALTLPAVPAVRAVDAPPKPGASNTVDVTITVNRQKYSHKIDPRVTLLDFVRDRLGLTGSKKGCDHGQCGACTMLVDGRRLNGCLALAVVYNGREVVTVEGLAEGDKLSPLQDAFIKHDGFQCGYCTPGQLCSAAALLKEGHAKSDDEIREWMSGNLCRCGAYPNIVAAIREVAGAKN